MVWVPISADYFAGAYTARSTVHAIPFTLKTSPKPLRTVCGVDVPLWVWGSSNGDQIIAQWPPPKEQRCTDCEAAIGKRMKTHPYWEPAA